MALGVRINPMAVQPGSEIATKFDPNTLEIRKSRKVKKVEFCAGSPEKVHLDHECYDSRFTTVVVKK